MEKDFFFDIGHKFNLSDSLNLDCLPSVDVLFRQLRQCNLLNYLKKVSQSFTFLLDEECRGRNPKFHAVLFKAKEKLSTL